MEQMEHLNKKINQLTIWMAVAFAVFLGGMLTELYFPDIIRWVVIGMVVLFGLVKIALPWLVVFVESLGTKEE